MAPTKRHDDEIAVKHLTVETQLDILGAAFMHGAPIGGMLSRGNVFYLDPTNGDDDYDGLQPNRAKATLAAVYALCTDGQHDVVAYISGTTGLTLPAAFDWKLSYTHFVGICAPTHAAQRARIFQLGTLTGASPLFKVSGSGCIMKNLYFFQGVADATSLIDVQVTGSRNYFGNVHFGGGGHATQAIDAGASLHISGGSENLFEDCTIGVDTAVAGNGLAGLVFAAAGGAARNVFRNCHFSLQSGNAGAIFVEVLGNAGIDRYQIFEHCLFTNFGTTMTQAIAVAADFDPANKRLILKDCSMLGATDWEAGNRGAVYLNSGTITGGGNAGIMQVSNST